MVVIPPVNTAPHGGHSTSQHSTTWWSFHQSTQHHMVVIPPVNTAQHGGHSTSQHSTTWWSFHQSTQHHMVVIPPANTAPRGRQVRSLWGCNYEMRVLEMSASAEPPIVGRNPAPGLLTHNVTAFLALWEAVRRWSSVFPLKGREWRAAPCPQRDT